MILDVDSSKPIRSPGFQDRKVDCNCKPGRVGSKGSPQGRVGPVRKGENHSGYKGVGGGE